MSAPAVTTDTNPRNPERPVKDDGTERERNHKPVKTTGTR